MRLILVTLLLLLFAGGVSARGPSPADLDARALDAAAREYRAIAVALNGHASTAERRLLHARASAVERVAIARTADLQAQLRRMQVQLAALGPVTPNHPEPARARLQRRQLERAAIPLASAVRTGDLLARDTSALLAETAGSPADLLVERLSVRAPSPLSSDFWDAIGAGLPHDTRRLSLLGAVEADVLAEVKLSRMVPFLLGLAAASAILFPLRLRLRGLGRRVMLDHAPTNRLRKSGQAAWIVASGTALPLVSALLAVDGVRAAGMLAPAWEPLAAALVRGAAVAGLICGLGAALLMRSQPEWRLLPLSTETARVVRPWTWLAAALVFAMVLIDAVRRVAGFSPGARDATDAIIAITHIGLAAALLVRIGRLRLAAIATGEAEDDGAGETGTALASLLAWAVTLLAAGSLLVGYLNLALLLARMLLWLPLVTATFTLALMLADDLATGTIAHDSALGRGLHRGFGVRASLIDQAGVCLSAIARLILILLAVTLATGPFGSNLDTVVDQFGRLAQGITIGQVTISPGAVLRSAAVLVAGLFVVRIVQHWLTRRYLPVTALDAGARNSIVMVARYAGLILVCLWALASLGIGVERIALLLSALSVGIGFGLQAITQNFVSGLILLAERPVKIGDLVRIGDQEGDVRRISVRATEIQIADRSTLIVPNSELITKTVRNMTLADPIGRVQLQFSVQFGADVAKVREMLLAMYELSPAVLDDPAPRVFVDSIADGRININSFAYVASPRDVYPTRSELLFRLLAELPQAGIDLGTAPQQMQLIGGNPLTGPSGGPNGTDVAE